MYHFGKDLPFGHSNLVTSVLTNFTGKTVHAENLFSSTMQALKVVHQTAAGYSLSFLTVGKIGRQNQKKK